MKTSRKQIQAEIKDLLYKKSIITTSIKLQQHFSAKRHQQLFGPNPLRFPA